MYSAVHGFWSVEEDLAEPADGPTGRGEVARSECLLAWNLGRGHTILTSRELM
jgi:hypothetical protein